MSIKIDRLILKNGLPRIPIAILLLAIVFFGHNALGADSVMGTAIHRDSLPATFAGELPCADCSGQRLVLTLFEDHTFRLRRTYLSVKEGGDKDFYYLGCWTFTANNGNQLVLRSGTKMD